MLKQVKLAASAAAVVLCGAFSVTQVQAATISANGFTAGIGGSLVADFSCPAGGDCANGPFDVDLSASMTLTLLGKGALGGFELADNQWRIRVDVANTTAPTLENGVEQNVNRLSVFGFATDPNIAVGSVTSDAGHTWVYTQQGSFPNFAGPAGNANNKVVEFCVSDAGNCAQGNNGGLWGGQSSGFVFNLTAVNDSDNLNFDFLGVRFQSVLKDGIADGSTSFQGTVIPLPAAGWLLLSGMGALGVLGHRRRRAAA